MNERANLTLYLAGPREITIVDLCRVTLELVVLIDESQTPTTGRYTLCFSNGASVETGAAPILLSGKTDLSRTEGVFTSSLRAELLGQHATFDPVNFSVDVRVRSLGAFKPDIGIERRWRVALVTFLESYITKAQSSLSSDHARGWFAEQMRPPDAPRH